jgi:hypothetical protein
MRKSLFTIFAFLLVLIGLNSATAQLSGIKAIPGDYATITAAVNDLNTQGVGSGGVTFNIAAGYAETLTTAINMTATGTSSNPIIFQKSGAGANPLITAQAGAFTPSSATPDGIWIFQGSDYVTIDGIDLYDPNTTNPATMEYGYGLFKKGVTDGCQYITIKNCVITLNRINNASGSAPMVDGSVGILVINSLYNTATTALIPTASTGSNSYNKFYSNTIQNCNYGIALYGYADVTPFTLGDFGNDVGGTLPSNGNSILNFGGGAASNPSAGIRANNQWGINISYNTINNNNGSGVNHATTLRGIYAQAGTSANATITYNNITLKGGGTTTSIYAIDNSIGSTAASNTVNISYNTITGSYTTATSGSFYSINNGSTAAILNITNNNISGISTPGTGAIYGLNCGSPGVLNVSNNTIKSLNKTAIGAIYTIYVATPSTSSNVQSNTIDSISNTATTNTANVAGIYSPSSAVIENYSGNIFRNFSSTGTATIYGIRIGSATGNKTLQNNQIYNIASTGAGVVQGISMAYGSTDDISSNLIYNFSSVAGTLYGINVTAGTTNTIYNNKIYTLSNTGTTGGIIYGLYVSSGTTNNIFKNKIYDLANNTSASPTIYGVYFGGGTTNNLYNNYIGDLRTPASGNAITLAGIYASAGTYDNLYFNTVYLNASSTGTLFGSSCIYASTTPTLDMRNNILVNLSTPVGATGFTTAYRRSTSTLTTYASTSNNNDFYAGTPGVNNLIMYDGTNSYQTMSSYKSAVTPRDNFSFSENPNFVSTVSSDANYLHINGTIASQIESGGVTISTPSIVDDYDGNPRYPNSGYPNNPSYPASAPDIGADEYAGIPLDYNAPSIVYTPLLNTSGTTSRTLTATITDASGVPTTGIGLPVLYWKINAGTYTASTATSLGSGQYSFTFGSGVVLGDIVSYYICAQDLAVPANVGSSPSIGASGFTSNPPAVTTPTTAPSTYTITASALSGDYTIGLTLFNKITGRNISFEKVIKKTLKEIEVEDPANNKIVEKGKTENIKDNTETKDRVTGKTKLVEVEEIEWIAKENGRVYDGPLYIKKNESPNYVYPNNTNGIYATITAAVTDLNLRGVGGATRFLLNDTSYSTGETFPITVNITNVNAPTAANTVTFKPNAGVSAVISGAAAGNQILRILNNYVTIDGSNLAGGTTRNLTIQNTSVTTPQVIMIGSTGTTPITNVTVKNSNIINGVNTSSAMVIYDATGAAGYFNNITIQNNSIQLAYIGVYCNAIAATGNGSGLLLNGNDINTTGTNSISGLGLYAQGVDGATITNNNIGNISTTVAVSSTGIWLATGTKNATISGNNITNVAYTGTSSYGPRGIAVSTAVSPANIVISGNTISGVTTTGSTAVYGIYVFSTTTGVNVYGNKVSGVLNSNTGGYGARGISISTTAPLSNLNVYNNFIWDVKGTGDAGSSYWIIGLAIEGAASGINVYANSVNLFGTYAGYSSATISAAFAILSTSTALDVRDNIFVNTYDNTNGASDVSYAVNCQTTNTAFTNINYNDYYVSGTPSVLGYLGASAATLQLWQTATGKDANSISGDPKYISNTDLHIDAYQNPSISNAGQYIATVSNDIDNKLRNNPPDIGASEFSYMNLISPANNTTGQLLTLNFVWNKAAGATGYNILLATDTGYTSIIMNDSTLTDSIKTVSDLSPLTQYYWKVRAKNSVGVWGAYTGTFNFKTIGTPTQVNLISPANNAVDQATTINFIWSKAIDQTVNKKSITNYWFEYANNSGFTGSIIDSSLTDTTKLVNGLNTNTAYYWRVRAKSQGGWGAFSSAWTFITVPNSPNVPVLLFPTNNAINQPYTNLSFIWSKAVETLEKKRQIGNEQKKSPLTISNYWFELATDIGFTAIVNRDSTLTDTTKTIATLSSNVNYYWRVKAKNQTGWSGFSSVFTFRTTLDPTFLSQANFVSVITPQIMSSGNTTRLPVVIRATVNNLVPNKLYRFYNGGASFTDIGTGAYGAGNPMFMNPDSNNFRYTTSVSLTSAGGYDVFRANGSGAFTGWFAFVNTGNTRFASGKYVIPSIQLGDSVGTLIARYALNDSIKVTGFNTLAADTCATGIYGISYGLPKNIVSLYDNTSGTGKPLSQTYLEDEGVTVASIAGFYSTNVNAQNGRWGTVIPNNNVNGVRRVEQRDRLTGNSISFNTSSAGLWPSGTNTVNPTGGTTALALLINDAPLFNSPVLVTPANGILNLSTTPQMTWNSVPTASNYRIQVSTDSTFTAASALDSAGITGLTINVPTGKLTTNSKYYWRVNGTNIVGTSAWSTLWNFTTSPNAPNVPVLYQPSNGAINQPTSITFKWYKAIETLMTDKSGMKNNEKEQADKKNAVTKAKETIQSDNPKIISKYWFELGTDSTFATVLLRDTSSIIDTTTSVSSLTNNTKYWWRVRAKNQTGWGSFSAAWNFTTIVAAPVSPTLLSPANGSTGISLTPLLDWNDVATATSYRVQVTTGSDSSTFTTPVWDSAGIAPSQVTVPAGKLAQNTKYFWRVNATNAGGTSAWTTKWNFTTLAQNLSLNLKVYLEGFWDGTQQVQDTVTVYLANPTTPFTFVDTAKVVLSTTGTATNLTFSRAASGSYYIVVNHRNHLETWSKLPQAFTAGTPLSYDFTTAATQAFGDNMKQVGSVWVLYGGDANQDGSIDGFDIVIFVPQFGTQGYLSADFNGDGDVNASDVFIISANYGLTKAVPTLNTIYNPPGKQKIDMNDVMNKVKTNNENVKQSPTVNKKNTGSDNVKKQNKK